MINLLQGSACSSRVMTCSLATFLVKEKQPAATSVVLGLYVGPVDSVRAALF